MKIKCYRCKQITSNPRKRTKSKKGIQALCLACNREVYAEWYAKNRAWKIAYECAKKSGIKLTRGMYEQSKKYTKIRRSVVSKSKKELQTTNT